MTEKKSFIKKALVFILGVVIFGGALFTAKYFMTNKPRAEKVKKVIKIIPLVNTVRLPPINHQIKINAMGNVVAAKKINLVSQVKGEIIYTNHDFVPGGLVNKGETLIKIEPIDYELVKLQRKNDVEKANNDLAIEMGKQLVAQKEYSLLGTELEVKDKKLILRKPYLSLSHANLASAKAKLKQAQYDLTRTIIKAPFNALIENPQVNIGSWQNAGSNFAGLISTDQFWIEVNLPVDRLALLNIPEFNSDNASKAVVSYPVAWGNKTREAKVKRLKPNLDSTVRMAQLILKVDDPLSFQKQNANKAKLLLGSFVKVSLQGKLLNNVLAVPRQAIRNYNKVWLLTDNKLNIVEVSVLWKTRNTIYIQTNNTVENAEIITSDLSAPIAAMQLSKKVPSE